MKHIAECEAYENFTKFVDRIIQQCDEFSATVQEGSKLLTEARENLSEALKGISLTGDFARVSQQPTLTKAVTHEGGTAAVATRKPPINHIEAGLAQSSPSPAQILEAERNQACQAHRLEQEYAERFPEE